MTDDKVLAFVRFYIKDKGYAPSLDDIADGTGMSKSGARYRLFKLREAKLIDFKEDTARSYRITQKGE